jgi:hypothetical protein
MWIFKLKMGDILRGKWENIEAAKEEQRESSGPG